MADFPWEDEYATPEAAYPWEENYDSYFDQVEAADAAREMAAEPDFAADARPEDFAARGYAPDPTVPDPVELAQILGDQGVGFRNTDSEVSAFDQYLADPAQAATARLKQGLLSSGLAPTLPGDTPGLQAARMADYQRQIEGNAPVESVEKTRREANETDNLAESLMIVLSDPQALARTFVESTTMFAPVMAAGAAASFTGGPLAAFATGWAGSGLLEYTLAADEVMGRHELNPDRPDSWLKITTEPALKDEMREIGTLRGLTVGFMDGVSMGLAGRLLAGAGPSFSSKAVRALGEVGLQMGTGGGGEYLGQKATGVENVRWGAVAEEMAAEAPTALWEAPGNYRQAKAAAERNQFNKELKGALGLNEPPAPLTEQDLAGALGISLPERQPVPTEREIIERAREDAQRILRGETLDIAETPPVDQLRLNPGYTAPGNEIVMGAVPGGVELAPRTLYSRDIEAERPMDLPAGPFAATQPALPTIAPAPIELPKPRMRMPAARSTTMPAPEAGATSGQIESPPPTAGTPQAVPTEPPGPREPPGPPPAPPAAPAGPGGSAEAPAASVPTEAPPAADEGAKRASAAPTEQFPIEESDFSRQRRESAELTELVEVDAQAALEAFEEDRGEALAWNPKRTAKLKEIVGSGGKIDAYPQVAINNGKFDVGDGRHRIALAAERGETITLAAHPDEATAIRQRLGAPAASRTPATAAPAKVDILTPVSRRGRAAKAAAPAPESAAPGVSPGAAAATAAPAPTPSEGPAAAPTIDRVPATAAYFDVTGQSQDPDGRPRPRDVLVYDAQGAQVARFPFDKSDDAVAFADRLKKARGLPHRWEYRPAAAQPPVAAPAESGEPQKTPMVPLSEKAKAAIDGLRKRAALASVAKIKENLKNYGASTSGAKAVLIERLAAAEEMVALLRANKIQSRQALRKRIWDNKATDELSLRLDELAGILYGGKGAATRPLQTSLFVGDKYPGRISPLLDFVGMPERVEGDVESVTGSPSTRPPAPETPKAETPKAETPKAETPSAADAGMADEGAPTTTSTAVEQAPAPTEEPDRETLYGKLRGKDVTVQVEVAGREVEVTRYAAEALREADNLVAALEEIRETCL